MCSAHHVGDASMKNNSKWWLGTLSYITPSTKNNAFVKKGQDKGKQF